ncbi:MAG TPA: NDP-sugar synthase [Pyrinomonadaceae bacterium]|jgi:NDP-sugar pyrophosphorylase family protein
MRAMILAAGYGTRLWPLTIDRAKPAIPFMGRPLVGYVAEYLARYGCREVAVNLHHRPESVRAALGDGSAFGVRLAYFDEPTILGTSGALDNARAYLSTDTFIVVNGKIATDIDLAAALATHRRTGALATLVLRPNEQRERYTIINVRDGLYAGLGGFPPSDNVGDATSVPPNREPDTVAGQTSTAPAPLMFTGIHILEPRIFDFIPRGVFSDSITDVYPQAMNAGERIAAHVANGMWHELSTVRRYLDTSCALMKLAGRDMELGTGAHVAAGADVRDAVLWEHAHVAAGARVCRAVLGAGVRVGAGETIEDAAVVRAELVRDASRPAKGLQGAVRGENFVAPLTR